MLVLLNAAVFLLPGCWWKKSDFKSQFSQHLSAPALESFGLEEERKSATSHIYKFSDGDRRLFVEVLQLTPEKARLYISGKALIINSLYTSYPSPYPGAVSQSQKCPQEFLPQAKSSEDISMTAYTYLMFANDRFGFGTCTAGQIKYKANNSFIFCKKTGLLFDIKYFIGSKTTESPAFEFNCQ